VSLEGNSWHTSTPNFVDPLEARFAGYTFSAHGWIEARRRAKIILLLSVDATFTDLLTTSFLSRVTQRKARLLESGPRC
jgi:hypothetical protein